MSWNVEAPLKHQLRLFVFTKFVHSWIGFWKFSLIAIFRNISRTYRIYKLCYCLPFLQPHKARIRYIKNKIIFQLKLLICRFLYFSFITSYSCYTVRRKPLFNHETSPLQFAKRISNWPHNKALLCHVESHTLLALSSASGQALLQP